MGDDVRVGDELGLHPPARGHVVEEHDHPVAEPRGAVEERAEHVAVAERRVVGHLADEGSPLSHTSTYASNTRLPRICGSASSSVYRSRVSAGAGSRAASPGCRSRTRSRRRSRQGSRIAQSTPTGSGNPSSSARNPSAPARRAPRRAAGRRPRAPARTRGARRVTTAGYERCSDGVIPRASRGGRWSPEHPDRCARHDSNVRPQPPQASNVEEPMVPPRAPSFEHPDMRPARFERATSAAAGPTTNRLYIAISNVGDPWFPTRPLLRTPRHAPGTIRTCDLSLRRAALYPLSYGRGKGECSGEPVSGFSPTAARRADRRGRGRRRPGPRGGRSRGRRSRARGRRGARDAPDDLAVERQLGVVRRQLARLDRQHAEAAVRVPAEVEPRDRLLPRVAALREADRALLEAGLGGHHAVVELAAEPRRAAPGSAAARAPPPRSARRPPAAPRRGARRAGTP